MNVRGHEIERAEKISVSLSVEMIQVIRESVAAGEFGSASEAVRLWQRQRFEDAERVNAIRARIRRSLEDTPPDMSLEEVDAHLDALFARAAASGR